MDSRLALQILSKHFTLEVDFLQAVLKVHYTLKRRERQENVGKANIKASKLNYIKGSGTAERYITYSNSCTNIIGWVLHTKLGERLSL